MVTRHLLRNSLLPIITLIGLSLPAVLSGAVVVEAVFNYPGMGWLFWSAAGAHDYPVLMGFTVVIAGATVLGNLLADVAYAILDPRITVFSGMTSADVLGPAVPRCCRASRRSAVRSLRGAVRDFCRNRLGVIGLVIIVLMVLFSFVGPLIYPTNQSIRTCCRSPSPPAPSSRSVPTPWVTTSSGG